MTAVYDQDFNRWVQETVQLLREGRWSELDLEHLIEEIEDLGKSERRALSSQLERILIHLLKWKYQPERRSDSWVDSINDGRIQILLSRFWMMNGFQAEIALEGLEIAHEVKIDIEELVGL